MISQVYRLLLLAALPAAANAQNKFATVDGSASPHLPTVAECLDALNTGQLLPPARDGRIRVIKGDVLYVVDLTPVQIACEGVKYSE